jgi:hypothetical protein
LRLPADKKIFRYFILAFVANIHESKNTSYAR